MFLNFDRFMVMAEVLTPQATDRKVIEKLVLVL